MLPLIFATVSTAVGVTDVVAALLVVAVVGTCWNLLLLFLVPMTITITITIAMTMK